MEYTKEEIEEGLNLLREKGLKEYKRDCLEKLEEKVGDILEMKEISKEKMEIINKELKGKRYNNSFLENILVDVICEIKCYYFKQGRNFERFIREVCNE